MAYASSLLYGCQDKDFRRRLNKRSAMEEIEAGGDSFFRAVADQLYGDQNVHSWIRYIVHVYMVRAHIIANGNSIMKFGN